MPQYKELEQLKKEYKSIPVPSDGIGQLSYMIEHAKADRVKAARKRRVYIRRYSVLAAAALLAVVVLPGMMGIFSMGGAADSNGMVFDQATESAATGTDWIPVQIESAMEFMKQEEGALEAEMEDVEIKEEHQPDVNLTSDAVKAGVNYSVAAGVKLELSEEDLEAINREVLIQIGEMSIENHEFVSIMSADDIYLDGEGCLVVVFFAGTLADESYGDITFTIPKAVFSAQE